LDRYELVIVVVTLKKRGTDRLNYLTGIKEFTIQEILFTNVWLLTEEHWQTFSDVKSISIPSGKRGLLEVHIYSNSS
jgi:hypothetical protein